MNLHRMIIKLLLVIFFIGETASVSSATGTTKSKEAKVVITLNGFVCDGKLRNLPKDPNDNAINCGNWFEVGKKTAFIPVAVDQVSAFQLFAKNPAQFTVNFDLGDLHWNPYAYVLLWTEVHKDHQIYHASSFAMFDHLANGRTADQQSTRAEGGQSAMVKDPNPNTQDIVQVNSFTFGNREAIELDHNLDIKDAAGKVVGSGKWIMLSVNVMIEDQSLK